jgi:hypothetical protein
MRLGSLYPPITHTSSFFYGFAGICDSPATRPDGNRKLLDPLSKILARQPSGVHKPKIVHASQFNFDALEQFLRRVVQLRVAILHIEPLA